MIVKHLPSEIIREILFRIINLEDEWNVLVTCKVTGNDRKNVVQLADALHEYDRSSSVGECAEFD